VHWQEITRSMDESTTLKVELSVDEAPEPSELHITIKPGDPPKPQPRAPISFATCARCGLPGRYVRSKYCDGCRDDRVPF
jgi:hypothetical protein